MSKTVKEMSDEELIEELRALFDCIYKADSCNNDDLIRYLAIWRELEERGYRISEEKVLRIRRSRKAIKS
jgi:hypothetical protein